MNQAFKQLESRIQELVLKLQQTGSENTQLNQKLASWRPSANSTPKLRIWPRKIAAVMTN